LDCELRVRNPRIKLGVVYDTVALPFIRLVCPLVIIADFVVFLPEQADELWMDE